MVYLAPKISTSESKKVVPTILELDPGLLKAARQIYGTYFKLHQKLNKNPIGVAIDRKTHRGQLLFCKQPILLPWENFISVDQLNSETY